MINILEFLDLRIESLFDNNMTWNNRGRRGWHFDHIRPTVSFDLLNEEQLKVCFNYRNFQPLWSTRNSAKSDDFSLQDELLWVKHMKKLGFEGLGRYSAIGRIYRESYFSHFDAFRIRFGIENPRRHDTLSPFNHFPIFLRILI